MTNEKVYGMLFANVYPCLILGYPIWHGQAPRIIDTFMESYDFCDKTIIPFCISHSSGIGSSDTYLHGLVSPRRRGYTAELLGNETIMEIADAHGVSAAQVILRWDLQNGVVVIPGSSNPDHILENTRLYDFSLTDDEMGAIKALNKDEKHDWY